MISAPRIVVVSVIFFPMGLFYYSSDNDPDCTISARNPPTASAMKWLPLSSSGMPQPDTFLDSANFLNVRLFRFVKGPLERRAGSAS